MSYFAKIFLMPIFRHQNVHHRLVCFRRTLIQLKRKSNPKSDCLVRSLTIYTRKSQQMVMTIFDFWGNSKELTPNIIFFVEK